MDVQVFQHLVDSLLQMLILLAADGIETGQLAEQDHEQSQTVGSVSRSDIFAFRQQFAQGKYNGGEFFWPDVEEWTVLPGLRRHEKLLEAGQLAEVELRHGQTLRYEEQIEKREFLLYLISVCESTRDDKNIAAFQRHVPIFGQMDPFAGVDADKFHSFVGMQFRRILIFHHCDSDRKIGCILEQVC